MRNTPPMTTPRSIPSAALAPARGSAGAAGGRRAQGSPRAQAARTYYLSAVPCSWDGTLSSTLSLERLPVLRPEPVEGWSVVEQTIEVEPNGGRVSNRVLLSGLTLDEARQCLSELLAGVATPALFSVVRLGDDVDTCLVVHHRHSTKE